MVWKSNKNRAGNTIQVETDLLHPPTNYRLRPDGLNLRKKTPFANHHVQNPSYTSGNESQAVNQSNQINQINEIKQIKSNQIKSNPIKSIKSIKSNPMKSNPILSNQSNQIQSNPIKSNPSIESIMIYPIFIP